MHRLFAAALLIVACVLTLVMVVWWMRLPSIRETPPQLNLVWVYEAPEPGSAVAAPLVTPNAIYLAAVHARGFHLSGAIYAIEPATGKQRWVFDRDGAMLPTASTPLLLDKRLFFGEGMHANFACRFYCLHPSNGKQEWFVEAGDHIEAGPVAGDGLVYFPAGNEGIYAVDVTAGRPKWNYRDDVHIDSTPALHAGRLYVGSGPSRRYKTNRVACLDATTGTPIWRSPMPLPAWSTPAVAGDRVFVGLGNGRLMESAKLPEVPAGALVCLHATSGAIRWTFPVADAVFGHPVIVEDRVIFGSRDGYIYCVSFNGTELFRVSLGGPVMASPTIDGNHIIAASVPGRVVCIDIMNGHEVWQHDLALPHTTAHVYAAPQVAGGRLYIAGEMRPAGSEVGIVTLYCYELPSSQSHQEGNR